MTKLSKQCLNCVRPRAACVVSSKVLIDFDADNPYYSFHKTLKKTKIFLIRITDRSSRSEVFCVWHRCFPVNFAKFLRTPSLIEHVFWLLLNRDVFRTQSIKVGAKTNNRLISDVWVGSECTCNIGLRIGNGNMRVFPVFMPKLENNAAGTKKYSILLTSKKKTKTKFLLNFYVPVYGLSTRIHFHTS